MNIPNNELGFSFSDLYPNFGGVDTSTLATPETDDQAALNEDIKLAEKGSATEVSGKKIYLALLLLVCLIVFLGGR